MFIKRSPANLLTRFGLHAFAALALTHASLNAASLVSRYEFENNFNDSSGNNLNGTGSGVVFSSSSPTPVQGDFDAEFGGNGDRVAVADNALQGFTGSFTLTGWFYLDQENGGDNSGLVAKWGVGNGHRGYVVAYENATNKLIFNLTQDGTNATLSALSSNSTLSLDTWYFFAAVYETNGTDAASMAIYINDAMDSTTSSGVVTSVFDTPDNLTMGSFYNFQDGNSLYGHLDDMRAYSGALSSSEISAVYHSVPEPSTIAYVAMCSIAGGLLYLRRRRLKA